MEERVIFEEGVVRLSMRQLTELWMKAEEKCGANDIIDIKQPCGFFNEEVSFSIFDRL